MARMIYNFGNDVSFFANAAGGLADIIGQAMHKFYSLFSIHEDNSDGFSQWKVNMMQLDSEAIVQAVNAQDDFSELEGLLELNKNYSQQEWEVMRRGIFSKTLIIKANEITSTIMEQISNFFVKYLTEGDYLYNLFGITKLNGILQELRREVGADAVQNV